MMELVDMLGMSAQFRICRMRTANSKTVGGTLNGNFCAPKVWVPEILVGGVFCMGGGAFRKKYAPVSLLVCVSLITKKREPDL